jgi:hypothetical protein
MSDHEAKTVFSARIPAELATWADHYAGSRGSTRTAVLVAALEHLRGFCESGVPDLPRGDERSRGARRAPSAARQGKVPASGGPSSPGSASPAVSRPAAGDAPDSRRHLVDVALQMERDRFGMRGASSSDRMRVLRRIRMGRVLVAGEVVRDPEALVDPSEVAV